MTIEDISISLGNLISWDILLLLFVGVIIGLIFGAIPGLGPVIGITLALPFTIPLDAWQALTLITSMYVGGMYGGAVSAVLINIPGTAAAIASTLDGYPLTQQNRSYEALNLSVISSSIGGLLSAIILILLIPYLIPIVLSFGTVEYALLSIFGMTLIPAVTQVSYLKGVISGSLGLLIATIGLPPEGITPRYTFGLRDLNSGVEFIAILIGMFAVAEMIKLSSKKGSVSEQPETNESLPGARQSAISTFLDSPITFTKSTVIGVFIGIIPAAGGAVSTLIAYGEEVRSSDDASSYGEGNPKGLVASEASNNATVPSSLIPLLSFGIPGSASAAVILGGMLLHGVQPGPSLFTENAEVTYQFLLIILLGSIVLLFVGLVGVAKAGSIAKVNTDILIPLIMVMCMIGTFAVNINYLDVFIAFGIGLLGYFMLQYNYSIIALVMGVLLGPLIELNTNQALSLGGGSLSIFVQSPISIVLIIAIVLSLLLSPGKIVVTKMRSK